MGVGIHQWRYQYTPSPHPFCTPSSDSHHRAVRSSNARSRARYRRLWPRRESHRIRYRERARGLALWKETRREVDLCQLSRCRPEVFIQSGQGTRQAHVCVALTNRDPQQTLQLFEKYQPTHVIHLAALGMSISNPRVLICSIIVQSVGGLFANRERKVCIDDLHVDIFLA